MTKNNPTVGFQNLPNSKVASRQLIRSIYQPGCIIINNCALCPLQAQGMASVPRSLRYACERAHTLGQSDCTSGRKQDRARSEIACTDGKLVVTLHRPNAGKGTRHRLQETHTQPNANTKTFHIMSKNIKAVTHELNTGQYAGVGRDTHHPLFPGCYEVSFGWVSWNESNRDQQTCILWTGTPLGSISSMQSLLPPACPR